METSLQTDARAAIKNARRVVIKIGSRILVQASGQLEEQRIQALAREMAALRLAGCEIVLVTSGAIGSGMQALGLRRRPTALPDLQMAAAIGQSRLMTFYDRLFAAEHCLVGQVLLTHDDLKQRKRHLNAQATILNMLRHGVIPIVNENDTVAVDEIKLGDNDVLASLVVHLINAELLILLTSTDGLRETDPNGRSRRVPFVANVTPDVLALARGKGSEISSGGMASKLLSAGAATKAGAAVVIADGRKPNVLSAVTAGADTGTLIPPLRRGPQDKLNARERWIAFFHKPAGSLIIDEGARRAIEQNGKSLLAIGIKKVEGDFAAGAAVDIKTSNQTLVARGLVAFSSRDVRRILGKHTEEIIDILGTSRCDEVVHRDNMVFCKGEPL